MEKSNMLNKNKTPEKSRLGRGLSALIPPAPRAPAPVSPPERPAALSPAPVAELPSVDKSDQVQEIPIAAIVPNTFQPRTQFDQAALDDLAASVKAHGILQPIMVRPSGQGRYELVAGERRFRAAELAGLSRVPVIVREISDEESLTVALIENIQREDLNAIEAARGYRQLLDQFELTQSELGRQLGKSQPTIANALALLRLPAEIQESVSVGEITAEHGKYLLAVADLQRQRELWQATIARHLSARQLREEIEKVAGHSGTLRSSSRVLVKDVHWQSLEDQFRTALGMKLELKPGRAGRGTLTIDFSTADEIETLLEKLNGA